MWIEWWSWAPELSKNEYIVKSWDTLSKIAKSLNVDMALLVKENKIVDIDKIKVGQKLNIPRIETISASYPQADNTLDVSRRLEISRWEKTDRENAVEALKSLDSFSAPINTDAILPDTTQVNIESLKRSGLMVWSKILTVDISGQAIITTISWPHPSKDGYVLLANGQDYPISDLRRPREDMANENNNNEKQSFIPYSREAIQNMIDWLPLDDGFFGLGKRPSLGKEASEIRINLKKVYEVLSGVTWIDKQSIRRYIEIGSNDRVATVLNENREQKRDILKSNELSQLMYIAQKTLNGNRLYIESVTIRTLMWLIDASYGTKLESR